MRVVNIFKNISLKLLKAFLFTLFVFNSYSSLTQSKNQKEYLRLLDSAYNYSTYDYEVANAYLDSISKPIENSLKDNLAKFYMTQGFIFDLSNKPSKQYQSFIQALKYAEIEKNYDLAGEASLELFANLYLIKKDSASFNYLNKANHYFELAKSELGRLDVLQMEAYVKLINKEHKQSNTLLLQHLERCKTVEDTPYYYMFALNMLVVNYLSLEDIDNALKYTKAFHLLKDEKNIEQDNYSFYRSSINIAFADYYYYDNRILDSSLYYLDKIEKTRSVLNHIMVKDYFKLKSKVHQSLNEPNISLVYSDSLSLYDDEMLAQIADVSIQTGNEITQASIDLKEENTKRKTNKILFLVFSGLFLGLLIFYFYNRKRLKAKIKNLKNVLPEITFLRKNQQQLNAKLNSVSNYLEDFKKEVKEISTIKNLPQQKGRIKDLYNNVLIKSSDLYQNGDTHIGIINGLNSKFFAQLKSEYPTLNQAELIVCYYIAMGFKNKEIAHFLNLSPRSVESKRYRITKKMNLVNSGETLTEVVDKVLKNSSAPPLNP